MLNSLKTAIDAAGASARDLGALAESLERLEIDPAKRVALIPLTICVGEFRDRLHSLELDMARAGLING